MQASSAVLASNVSVVAVQPEISIPGGRYVIAADGTTFPTTCQVQAKLMNGSFVSVGANLIAASLSAGVDLPAGTYRLNCAGGAAAALYVSLCRVPY